MLTTWLWFLQSGWEFLAALELNSLVTVKIKTFNAFEGRIIVLHIRWMPAWRWALLFCRMDRWASLRTWGSAEGPRACISCTCSWRLRTISGHHIAATWNNRSPWRSTWPSQKIWSWNLERSRPQSKSIEDYKLCSIAWIKLIQRKEANAKSMRYSACQNAIMRTYLKPVWSSIMKARVLSAKWAKWNWK